MMNTEQKKAFLAKVGELQDEIGYVEIAIRRWLENSEDNDQIESVKKFLDRYICYNERVKEIIEELLLLSKK